MTKEEDNSGDTDETVSRRDVMALTGLAGLGFGLAGPSTGTASASDGSLHIDGSNAMAASLDAGGYDIVNTDDIYLGDDIHAENKYASFITNGSGDGKVQFWDEKNQDYLVRGHEGGPVQVGTDTSIEGGLSVDGWNVVDVSADLGVSPGSGTDVAAEIDSFVGNDSSANYLFTFPNGTYTWNTTLNKTDFEALGFVGKPHATLNVTDPDMNLLFQLGGEYTPPERLVVKNFTVDITDDGDTTIDAGTIESVIGEYTLVENVTVSGSRSKYQDRNGDGSVDHDTNQRFSFKVQMANETGVCFMRNVKQPDGGTKWSSKDEVGHAIPFSSDPKHHGTKIYDQCYVEGFIDNGFYVMNSPGRNVLHGCTAKNNGGANVRLGVNDVCHDSEIVIDNANSVGYGSTGLWLAGSSDDYEGFQPFAENVRIDGQEAQNDLLRINSDANGAAAKSIDIYVGPNSFTEDGHAIEVTEGSSTPDRPVVLEDVTIRDDAGDEAPRFSVEINRDETTIRDLDLICSYDGSGYREGVAIDASHVTMESSRIRVSCGTHIVELRQSDNTFVNTRFEGTSDKTARFSTNNYDSAENGLYMTGCRFVNAELWGLSNSDITTSGNFGV
ncbi:hypothetical protein [Halorussus halophilus]|uniref:hypothetical protein n=1 Tax=Halorussus halophilus TaxID=2650975 RepID=UPI0013014EEC|nr:hypothetical protein [Halorussus halophilus]